MFRKSIRIASFYGYSIIRLNSNKSYDLPCIFGIYRIQMNDMVIVDKNRKFSLIAVYFVIF